MAKSSLDYAAIGMRVREKRIEQKISIEKLAELSGLSRTHMDHIETNHTKLSLPALVSVANALHVTADSLLCDQLVESQIEYQNQLIKQMEGATPTQLKMIVEIAKVVLRPELGEPK